MYVRNGSSSAHLNASTKAVRTCRRSVRFVGDAGLPNDDGFFYDSRTRNYDFRGGPSSCREFEGE